MRKPIEFQPSKNDSALLMRGKSGGYEDLVFTDTYRKYRHQFGSGKTKIRLLPAMSADSDWILEIPTLQHANGRHADPSAVKAGARSVYDLAYAFVKEKYPDRLFGRSNMTGIRLKSMPIAICWAVVEDRNGIRLRLLHNSFHDGERGGATGLGRKVYDQALRDGKDSRQLGHPLNHLDGTSLLVERIPGSDTKFPGYRVIHSDDRSPLQTLLEKVSDLEYNVLCPLKETIRVLEPEEEWRLLAGVIGDDLVAEIRSTEKRTNAVEGSAVGLRIEDCPAPKESPEVEETEVVADDYKDFPAKWML
jgi:hypothetical protein